MATWAYLGFQDSASPLMEQLIFFHDHMMLILILIITFVGYMLTTVLLNSLSIDMYWSTKPLK